MPASPRRFAPFLAGLAFFFSAAGAPAGETATKPPSAGKPGETAKDWPCQQILVDRISVAAVWSGPPIEDVAWRGDPATVELVALLAVRKTPLEAADRAIESFAAAAGADKAKKLTALFAGLLETLNNERGEIIDGLIRFGRKQKALATRIRAENAEIQKSPEAAAPEGVAADDPRTKKLELDLRAFDEGRRSLSFVCESPTLVEQRLFALARSIQNSLD